MQEVYTVEDQPPPPSEFLLLPSLEGLYKANVRNQESPQPGDSRLVIPPSQRVLSKQTMKNWEPWDKNMRKSNNHRMFQKLALNTQQTLKATSTQDLDPRPLVNNVHPSVLDHELYVLEPGEIPSHILSWTSLGFLSHINGVPMTIGSLFQFGWSGMFFTMICMEIIYRPVKSSLSLHRYMTG